LRQKISLYFLGLKKAIWEGVKDKKMKFFMKKPGRLTVPVGFSISR